MVAFILLVIVLYAVLHYSPVQTWVVQKVAVNLSQKLNTKVTVKSVDFRFFNKLLLKGLMIEDRKKDTLLSAGTAKINITDWFFFKDKVSLHYIGLDDAIVNMNRTDSVWNYQFLIDYFDSPSTGKKKKGIELNLKELHFTNIQFNKIDKWIGQDLIVSMKKMDVDVQGADFNKNQLIINDISLLKPFFSQSDYEGNRPKEEPNLKPVLEKIPVVAAFKWNNEGWIVKIKQFKIADGSFANDKHTERPIYADRFDDRHVFFSSINGSVNNMVFINDTLNADMLISAKERSGLILKKLQSSIKFTPEKMEFANLELVTNKSRLGNYFSMSYNAFRAGMSNFLHNVTMDGHFVKTELNSEDLAIFSPNLKSWKRIFYIDGNARGSVDNFSGKNLRIKTGYSFFSGDVAFRGLPNINSTFIDVNAKELKTTYSDLITIAPSLRNVNQVQLHRLGNIYYTGNFTGFVNDFVAFGSIKTNLGNVSADINMKLSGGRTASYSGKISTSSFNLGSFINNNDFGNIAMNGKVKGSGFTLKNLNANFDGSFSNLYYKGYNYQNIFITGNFEKKIFTGHLTMNDPNIKLTRLDGVVSLSGKEMAFNASANLQNINLKKLRFLDKDVSISGLFDLNFTGNNIDNFLGIAKVNHAKVRVDSTVVDIADLTLNSYIKNNRKYLSLQTNEVDAEVNGNFTLLQLPDAFKALLNRYYPSYINPPSYAVRNQDFVFYIKTKNVDKYVRLIDKKMKGFDDATLSGSINLANYELNVNADVPEFIYDGKVFKNIILKGVGNYDTLKATVAVDDVKIKDSLHFPDTRLQVTATNDLSIIHLKTSAGQTLNDAELNASVKTFADGVQIHFFPSSFIINDKKWELEKDGELTIRDNYFDASEVKFVQGNQQIILSTQPDELKAQPNILAKLQQVDMSDFMPFITTQPKLEGFISGNAKIKDPFGKTIIEFTGVADSFKLDDRYIGKVLLDAEASTITGLVTFKANASDSIYAFNIDGNYNYKDSSANQMNINLLGDKMNLNILEPYLGTIFSKMDGIARTKLRMSGNAAHPYITGQATIDNGSVKIAYTQCSYHFTNEIINFNKDEIDFGNIRIKDSFNNYGMISGKMYHKFFKKLYFEDIKFSTEKMLLLNTTKKDNEQFYGNVTGSAVMTLNGPITNLRMDIDGEPDAIDSSHIYLPTGSSKESNAINYIEFIQFGTKMEEEIKTSTATNILVNMTLNANPACKIDVILDEETGDIIKGQGNGVINIRVGTNEPLSMRGRYDLTKGEYTFNFQTFLKKPFTLNSGSISWNGDPYQALINIEAEYLAKNVDISSLSTSGSVRREDVTIVSHLTGVLQKPIIKFNFKIPEKSSLNRDLVAVKKLEDYKNDENEMNKQVASLLLFNSFINSSQNFLTTANTLGIGTGLIGGVISGWLTNIFNKELSKATNGVLSTYIDINPTINLAQKATQLQANVRAGVQILLTSRLILLIGVNQDVNNPYAQLADKKLLTPDITIEWLLNKDGSLRVVGFNNTNVDFALAQQVNRSGIQLSYRKNFNKLSDIFKKKKKPAPEAEPEVIISEDEIKKLKVGSN